MGGDGFTARWADPVIIPLPSEFKDGQLYPDFAVGAFPTLRRITGGAGPSVVEFRARFDGRALRTHGSLEF